MSDLIVGIDLGTTNSEVAAFIGGKVRVLGPGDQRILPSCVGFSASGELLVGEPRAISRLSIRSAPCAASSADGQRRNGDAG